MWSSLVRLNTIYNLGNPNIAFKERERERERVVGLLILDYTFPFYFGIVEVRLYISFLFLFFGVILYLPRPYISICLHKMAELRLEK